MTKVLAAVKEQNSDPIISIVDLDETKGMVPIGALNGVVEVKMQFLSNEQARSIRKAMDNGLRGLELAGTIDDILAPPPPEPAEEVSKTGSVPANQDPSPVPLADPPGTELPKDPPPTGFDAADAPTGA